MNININTQFKNAPEHVDEESFEEQVFEKVFSKLKEGFREGELVITLEDDSVVYGWWSKSWSNND